MKKAATRWQPLFGLGSVECQRDVSLTIILACKDFCKTKISKLNNILLSHFSPEQNDELSFTRSRAMRSLRSIMSNTKIFSRNTQLNAIYSAIKVVGAAGLEPARPKSRDFKSPASANSATPPDMSSYYATTFNSAGAKLAAKSQATAFPGKR